jgi:hypothetical protein
MGISPFFLQVGFEGWIFLRTRFFTPDLWLPECLLFVNFNLFWTRYSRKISYQETYGKGTTGGGIETKETKAGPAPGNGIGPDVTD